MNRGFIGGMIAVVLIAGSVFYFEKTPARSVAVATDAPVVHNGAPTPNAAPSEPDPVPQGKTVTATPTNSPMFFESVQIDAAESPPRACLQFSEPVPTTQDIHFKDYLSITPKADTAFQAAGRQVCLTGLTYGKNYSVVIAAGFPAANGDHTASASTASITFGDAPASVDFANDGFILPRNNVEGRGDRYDQCRTGRYQNLEGNRSRPGAGQDAGTSVWAKRILILAAARWLCRSGPAIWMSRTRRTSTF